MKKFFFHKYNPEKKIPLDRISIEFWTYQKKNSKGDTRGTFTTPSIFFFYIVTVKILFDLPKKKKNFFFLFDHHL